MDAGSQALAEALRGSFAIIKVVMVLLVLLFLASGFFTVGPQERAILLRFVPFTVVKIPPMTTLPSLPTPTLLTTPSTRVSKAG